MLTHGELTDDEFEHSFAVRSLDAALFTHEAHLRLAWIHIRKYGVEQAIANITGQLSAFVESLGVQDKYHVTVTVAAVRAVYHFMLKSPSRDFKTFIAANPRLKNEFKELLAKHYSVDLFGDSSARKVYLEPDLLPFD